MQFTNMVIGMVVISSTHFTLAFAGECCAHCGCQQATKVCRQVYEEKKLTVICWGYQDDELVLHGPNCKQQKHEDVACHECDPQGKVCFQPKRFLWFEWTPREYPQVYTQRKLMKRTVTKTIPSYKWVTEFICSSCEEKINQAQTSSTQESSTNSHVAKQIPAVPPLEKD